VDSSAASESSSTLPPGKLKCDKCDGPHLTTNCPHFPKERDNHPDALMRKPTGLGSEPSDGSIAMLVGAQVRHQPGDGNCLFHSLAHGLGPGTSAGSLRREVCAFIERNGDLEISGTPLHQWVKWDSNSSVGAYARRMAGSGCWGGGIELACVAKLKKVDVSVYEPSRGSSSTFRRIGQFVSLESTRIVHVLYRGGVHYDALEGGTLKVTKSS